MDEWFAGVEGEMRTGFAGVEREMRTGFARLEGEMKEGFASVHGEIGQLAKQMSAIDARLKRGDLWLRTCLVIVVPVVLAHFAKGLVPF
jgi:hypothetical protein